MAQNVSAVSEFLRCPFFESALESAHGVNVSQRAATLGPQGHTAVAAGVGSPTLAPSVGLWERRHIQVVSCQLGGFEFTRFFGNTVFVALFRFGKQEQIPGA